MGPNVFLRAPPPFWFIGSLLHLGCIFPWIYWVFLSSCGSSVTLRFFYCRWKMGRKKKKKKTQEKASRWYVWAHLLCLSGWENITFLLDCVVYFYITHTSCLVFSLSCIFSFCPSPNKNQRFFVFQQGSSAPLYVEKHSKVDKRKKKSRRGVEVMQPQQIRT